MFTGEEAVRAVKGMTGEPDIAIDIETPNVTDSFTIKCVTAAWEQEGETRAVLLDPLRDPRHFVAVQEVCIRAKWLILHNSPFDIPGLVVRGLMQREHISKVMDTLVLARMAWPDTMDRKNLEALADRLLGMKDMGNALKLAQKASGLTSNDKWFREGDIHIPTYRNGAMADTIVTLRLAHPLFEAAVDRQLDHPFAKYGHTDRASASELVLKPQVVNRIMLKRASKGYRINPEHLDRFVDATEVERVKAVKVVEDAGLRPGVGADIIKYLDTTGELPARWPRTKPSKTRPQGTLKADKETLERLLPSHPLADAHRTIAHTDKMLGYMEKVTARSRVSGRLHPQWQILGASATGRMSCSEPELQQFPEEARPIILCDEEVSGLSSIDWSSIEPALLGWMSQDWEFITPFEQGADIYEPVMRAAGCTRKDSKTVVLAGMYGQGREKLAAKLGMTVDEAADLQRQMRAAMPRASRYMGLIKNVAQDHGVALTVAGRVLPIPVFNGAVAVHKAVNYTIQGSCADLVYDAILAMEDMGIADHIYLPMHDEIVCATEVAEEVERIMQTPPQRLIERAGGRVPVIRTDNQSIGKAWIAC
jgi:DNA polymerase-1